MDLSKLYNIVNKLNLKLLFGKISTIKLVLTKSQFVLKLTHDVKIMIPNSTPQTNKMCFSRKKDFICGLNLALSRCLICCERSLWNLIP